MKVFLPNDSRMSWGGAWTFLDNFKKGASQVGGIEVVASEDEADVFLVAGATLVRRDTFNRLKTKGRVILRVDGIPEDWRNRGAGWSRLRRFFMSADAVVYQSRFIVQTVGRFLVNKVLGVADRRPSALIYNGVDTDIFKREGERLERFGIPSVLHVSSRKDPNKRVEEVIERFRYFKLRNPGATLTLVGKYPTEMRRYGFGLYELREGKDWRYLGIVQDPGLMAKVMRSHDEFWFPSFADPCPNALIEALHCGLNVRFVNSYGGAADILVAYNSGYDFGLENMVRQYRNFLEEVMRGEGK